MLQQEHPTGPESRVLQIAIQEGLGDGVGRGAREIVLKPHSRSTCTVFLRLTLSGVTLWGSVGVI